MDKQHFMPAATFYYLFFSKIIHFIVIISSPTSYNLSIDLRNTTQLFKFKYWVIDNLHGSHILHRVIKVVDIYTSSFLVDSDICSLFLAKADAGNK